MDNPKIIIVNKNTKVSVFKKNQTYETTHTQNYFVISETETHFFYIDKNEDKVSVWKDDIKEVTCKNRIIKFKDYKKIDVEDLIIKHDLLISLAQKMSKLLSLYSIKDYDMSDYKQEDLNIKITKLYFILSHNHFNTTDVIKCAIPKKYLWDHSWRSNIKKDYNGK
jgi:hypothetical protein